MRNKMNKTRVSELMQADFTALSPDMSLTQALSQLSRAGVSQGLVVDKDRLVGAISSQDILRGLWSCEFDLNVQTQVRDMMQTELTTVSADETLGDLLESWVVDREKLFPVNDMGSLICSGYLSYEERLRKAASPLPELLPVMAQDKLLGVLSRQQLGCWVATQMS